MAMMTDERCTGCGGYIQPWRRFTLARKVTGDKLFDGYQCHLRWIERIGAAKKPVQ